MFILYLKPGCPYCKESMELVKKYNLKYKFITENYEDKREILKKKHNMNTFPQIFYLYNNTRYKIGGNAELKKKLNHCIKLGNSIQNNNLIFNLHITKNIFKNKLNTTKSKKLNELIKIS